MENAKIKVVRFNEQDVIATSGKLLTINNTINGIANDATFAFGGNIYSASQMNENLVNNYFGTGAWNAKVINNNANRKLSNLVNLDLNTSTNDTYSEGKKSDTYNYTFEWNGTSFAKQ